MMNARQTTIEAEMVSRLERLACGELDENARGPLLAWLEEDPLRWRLCGLAFLEAQSWSETLAEWPTAVTERREISRKVVPALPSTRARRPLQGLVAAACLLVAFALGLGAREIASQTGAFSQPRTTAGSSADERPGEPLLASLTVQPGSGFAPGGTIHVPVVPSRRTPGTGSDPLAEIPDYVREQWERRGYKLSTERRYLFAHLPDGQQAVVPVEQVVVHPIPQKVN